MHIMQIMQIMRVLRENWGGYTYMPISCKKLIHFRCCLGVQFRINILQSRANHVLPHVIKLEAIDRLSWTEGVPANVAGTSYTLSITPQGGNKNHLCSPSLANKSLAPWGMLWQGAVHTTHMCNCKVQENVVLLSQDALWLHVISRLLGFCIWWGAHNGALIGETTAKAVSV